MTAKRLSSEQKAFIVQALACFDTPSTVARAFKAAFGAAVSPQAVEAYDPTKRAGERLGEHWRELFDATREGFL